MNANTSLCLATLALILAEGAHAKSAAEVFESVSSTVVIVYGNDSEGKYQSLGSGVVLPSGEVVTNCHVVDKANGLVVKHQDQEHPATLRHADHDRDVCSLVVQNLKAPSVTVGATKGLKVGQRVYAIGAPKGLELTLSEGIVSGLREVEGGRYIQTTAPISPGSSGGGLFDEEGRLVGLPTFYLGEGQQLNFAVPVEWIKELPQRRIVAMKAATPTVEWLNKSLELQEKQDWSALIQHAQRWIKARPGHSTAWFALGVAYQGTNQMAKATEAYRRALRIDPELVEAWNNLGLAYGRTNQTAKAIEAYQQALRIDPEHFNAWYNLGLAYWTTNRPKAIEAFQEALHIDPEDVAAWYSLRLVYRIEGRANEVIGVYRQLKAIDPNMADQFFSNIVLP